jgi:hypothetical protein
LGGDNHVNFPEEANDAHITAYTLLKERLAMTGHILLALLIMLWVAGHGSLVAAQDSTAITPPPASEAVQLSTEEDLDAITLDRAVYFLTADGTDVIAPPGPYRVKVAEASKLHLTPANDANAMVVQAITIHHKEQVAEPVALSIPDREDRHHVVLLLAEGQGLDAVASYNAVRTRGWDPTPAVIELIEKAFEEKKKPIRKDEKKGGH